MISLILSIPYFPSVLAVSCQSWRRIDAKKSLYASELFSGGLDAFLPHLSLCQSLPREKIARVIILDPNFALDEFLTGLIRFFDLQLLARLFFSSRLFSIFFTCPAVPHKNYDGF
jgi:hypothetical protein